MMIAFHGLPNVYGSIRLTDNRNPLTTSKRIGRLPTKSLSSSSSSFTPHLRQCINPVFSLPIKVNSHRPCMQLHENNSHQQSMPSSVEDLPLEYIPDQTSDLPETWSQPGVYGIYDENGTLQYIGHGMNVGYNMESHIKNVGKHSGKLGGVRMILFKDDVGNDVLEGLEWNWIQAHSIVGGLGLPPGNDNKSGESRLWKVDGSSGAVDEMISALVEKYGVVVFMKGTRDMPMCGFSDRLIRIIKSCIGEDFVDVNCLDEVKFPGMREGIKTFSQWPTIPQLYVNGEFVGGSDVAMELYEQGELQTMLRDAVNKFQAASLDSGDIKPMLAQDKIRTMVENNRVVCFMKGTMDMPMCGFSDRMVGILKACLNDNFLCVNCLDEQENPGMREEIKKFSDWPTLPQLYIDGELIGGSDVVQQMYQEGELEKLLEPIIRSSTVVSDGIQEKAPSESNLQSAESSKTSTMSARIPVQLSLEPPPSGGSSSDKDSPKSVSFNSDQFINALWDQTREAAIKELSEMRKTPLEIIPTDTRHFPDSWARPGVYGVYSDVQELQYIGRSRDVRGAILRHVENIGRHEGRIHAVRMRTYEEDIDERVLEELANVWVLQRSLRGSGPPPGNLETSTEWKDTQDELAKTGDVVGVNMDVSGENVQEELERILKENRVVLLVQGTQERPMCDNSAAASRMLAECIGNQFVCVHCLDEERNPGLRDAIQIISGSSSIPQLFIDGKYKGGFDAIKKMYQKQELEAFSGR